MSSRPDPECWGSEERPAAAGPQEGAQRQKKAVLDLRGLQHTSCLGLALSTPLLGGLSGQFLRGRQTQWQDSTSFLSQELCSGLRSKLSRSPHKPQQGSHLVCAWIRRKIPWCSCVLSRACSGSWVNRGCTTWVRKLTNLAHSEAVNLLPNMVA